MNEAFINTLGSDFMSEQKISSCLIKKIKWVLSSPYLPTLFRENTLSGAEGSKETIGVNFLSI